MIKLLFFSKSDLSLDFLSKTPHFKTILISVNFFSKISSINLIILSVVLEIIINFSLTKSEFVKIPLIIVSILFVYGLKRIFSASYFL